MTGAAGVVLGEAVVVLVSEAVTVDVTVTVEGAGTSVRVGSSVGGTSVTVDVVPVSGVSVAVGLGDSVAVEVSEGVSVGVAAVSQRNSSDLADGFARFPVEDSTSIRSTPASLSSSTSGGMSKQSA
jgi:hypothetical protein